MTVRPLVKRVQLAAALIAVAAAARPLAAQGNSSALSVSVGSFTTPNGADFAAGEIRATVTFTITCGNKNNCVATMEATGTFTKPGTAATNVQYSFNSGASWTTLTTTPVSLTLASVPTGVTSGSFLVRYQLGWATPGSPYTPQGSYSFPVEFTVTQGQP